MTRITLSLLALLALLALSLPVLAQGGFSAPPEGVTFKMGKPDPQKAKEFKAKREKLLKDLKLTPAQKKSWDAIEAKSKAGRMALIQKLQAGGNNDMMGSVQKLQALGEDEKTQKLAILTPAQKKIFLASPGGGTATSVQTRKG
jgi:hypothetical protein